MTENIWKILEVEAWNVRESAFLIGKTKVGCALYSAGGKVYKGCNVEHRFRCHDVHAEVNAISSMVANGEQKFKYMLVVAEREQFTPCGSCMDWIMQHCEEDAIIGIQSEKEGEIRTFRAMELMPHYPK